MNGTHSSWYSSLWPQEYLVNIDVELTQNKAMITYFSKLKQTYKLIKSSAKEKITYRFDIRKVFADVCQCQKMSFDASPRFVAEKMLCSNKHFRVGLSSAAFLMNKLNHLQKPPTPTLCRCHAKIVDNVPC